MSIPVKRLKYPGFATTRGAALAALLIGAVANTQAASYSNLYIFGDSLSDSGTFGPMLGVGRYAHFTTKPGAVWAENVGASYGLSVTPAYTATPGATVALDFHLSASGNNLAIGDARINAAPPSNTPEAANLPSVRMQVDGFLARGALDPSALYVISGGHNDVFAQLGGAPEAAQTAMVTAADDLTAQVTRLQSAGARHLIVVGIMDISQTPIGRAQTPADAAQLKDLIATFETQLTAGLAGKNLLYFNTGRLLDTVLADPAAFGFTNTTDPACGVVDALQCQVPANGHLFADNKHPSTSMHRVISDWVYGSLEGAHRMGLLSQLALTRSSAQWRSIDARMQEFQNFGYQGQGVFVTADYASSDNDASVGLPSADGKGGSVVVGYEKAFTDRLFGGVTLGYGNAPFDLGNHQGTVEYDNWALSAFASHRFGAFYANALATYSWLDFQSRRHIALGPFTTRERGDTDGDQFGMKGQVGYNFVSGHIVHGPLVGLAWERVKVDGFSEESNSVTAMTFGDQTRESLRSRIGWQIAAETHWSGATLRPYAQLTYDYEHLDDERSYRAGFVGGSFGLEIETANQTGGYGTLLVGVTTELTRTLHLGIGATTTIGQPDAQNSAINLTLGAAF
jgi:outer membrane lipase/esterase